MLDSNATGSTTPTMTDREDLAAELVDISFYRESAWFRARFVLWRSLGLLIVVYVANVMVNAVEIAARQGPGALLGPSGLMAALLISEIIAVSQQIPAFAYSFVGVLCLSIALSITARVRYELRRRLYRRQLVEFKKKQIREFKEARPDAQIDVEANAEAWAAEIVGTDAAERITKLQQIREWFRYDELLVDWTDHAIDQKRLLRNLTASVLTSAAAVVFVRVILLLK